MEKIIIDIIKEGIGKLYKSDPDNSEIQLQDTRKDFNGDITLVVFPLLRYSGKSPEQTANDIGKYLVDN